MEGILKVKPEQLEAAATEFSSTASSVGNLTNQMTSLVKDLASSWTGDASTTFAAKFNGLNDDIQRMIAMINEHSADLIDMANTYKAAEQANASLASSLLENVID